LPLCRPAGEAMNDRELLELAAKAAGLEIKPEPFADGERLRASGDGYWWPVWNPLTDDGDALRLAVKLRLRVEAGNDSSWAVITRSSMVFVEKWRVDILPEAATRRAIVRAAAEIAKS